MFDRTRLLAACLWVWGLPALAPAVGAPSPVRITTSEGHLQTTTFARINVGMEGTQLSCRQPEITFLLAPLERAPQKAFIEDDQRQANAFATACAAARATGACVEHVFVPRRQRTEVAHFLLHKDDTVWFGKAVLPPTRALEWQEPAWTRYAAARGWAPPVHEAPGLPHVLLSTYLPTRPLGRLESAVPGTRRAVLARLREIHVHERARLPLAPMAAPVAPAAAQERVADAVAAGHTWPLSLTDLQQRLIYIEEELRELPIVHTVCHGDPAVGNTLFYGEQLFHIDWEAAGWDDPMRDVARLVSHSQWPPEALEDILREYLGHAPAPEQLRHLALLVANFDIDNYGSARAAYEGDSVYVLRFAKRITADCPLLFDAPKVAWRPAEHGFVRPLLLPDGPRG